MSRFLTSIEEWREICVVLFKGINSDEDNSPVMRISVDEAKLGAIQFKS